MSNNFLPFDVDLQSVFPNVRAFDETKVHLPFTIWVAEEDEWLYVLVDQRASIANQIEIGVEIEEETLAQAMYVMRCRAEDERIRVIDMLRRQGSPDGEGDAGSPSEVWPSPPYASGSDARTLGEDYEARDWK